MTAAAHADDSSPASGPFSAGEWQAFRDSDIKAARAIVVLITSIFVIGIVLYTIVAATL